MNQELLKKKKEILGLKTVIKMKNSPEGLSSRFELSEERISEFGSKFVKVIKLRSI